MTLVLISFFSFFFTQHLTVALYIVLLDKRTEGGVKFSTQIVAQLKKYNVLVEKSNKVILFYTYR